MPKLYSTLGRAALVALGLAVAPAAFAQSGCPSGMTATVSGVGTASAEAVCALTCNGGDVVAFNGGTYSCQPPGGGNVGVSGCTLTPTNPAAVPSGGSVTYTARCTGGTPAAMTLQWSKTGPATLSGCASSGNVGDSITCQATNITGNGSVTVVFSNGVGSSSTKSASYAVQTGGGGGGFQNCPSGSITDSSWYPHLNPGQPYEPDVGVFNSNGQIMSIKMTVPAGASGNKSGFFSAVNGGYKISTWAVSKTACDFDSPLVDVPNSNFAKNKIKYLKAQTSSNISFSYSQGAGPEGVAGGVTMVAGQTYYLNIRLDSCDVIGQGCYYGGSYLQ